jgi:hypothetical protein
VGSGRTISTQDAIAQNNANMSEQEKSFYNDYMFRSGMGMSPSAQGVVRSVSQPTGMREGVMEAALPQQPSVEQGVASARFGTPSQFGREPMAPVTADISGLKERVGVRTAYGMVYPTAGQESAAQQLAMRSPMQGRLENVRAEMTQAEKIAAIRQNARARSIARGREMEQDFKTGSARIAELRKEEMKAAKANRSEVASLEPRRGRQTRQRSWSNYAGGRPAVGFNSEGNPIVPVSDGNGGWVVPNEEGGYSPYG